MKIKSWLALILAGSLTSGQTWAKPASQEFAQESQQLLQRYLQIDTTNPPGREMATAQFLKQILDREGIENQLFDLGNGRANLYAILRGDGSKKGLALLHHMDVVAADPQYWSAPPFSGEIRNGVIYGRGAIDIKAKGIMDLMTMVRFKRDKTPLKRDLVFLAVADEEVGSLGSRTLIAQAPDLLKNVEFVLDEGETIGEDAAGHWQYAMVGIGEKSPLWLNLTFKGNPGHGSVPLTDSSVNKAVRAAGRILNWNQNMPFQILPGLGENLRLQYPGDITQLPGYQENLNQALKNAQFLKALSQVPNINALLRNTISITGLSGSDRVNIIPNEASLKLDCRLIPGENKEAFIQQLKTVVGEPVEIQIEEYYQASYSDVDTALMQALKKVLHRKQPDLSVVPTIFTSSTDSSLYRALGLQVYGFESIPLDKAIKQTAHGNDERVKIASFEAGLDLLHDLILELNL